MYSPKKFNGARNPKRFERLINITALSPNHNKIFPNTKILRKKRKGGGMFKG